jgi:hypothetical protein
MPTMIVRVVPREDAVGEPDSATRALFAALQDRRPPGIAYHSLREQDGGYLLVLRIQEGVENPLPSFPDPAATASCDARSPGSHRRR